MNTDNILGKVNEALSAERRLIAARGAYEVTIDESGVITLEGEVDKIAEKRIALERTAAVRGVAGIVDRLRVRPSQPMKDKVIRHHILGALARDLAFANIDLYEREEGGITAYRSSPQSSAGEIIVESCDGVVTLSGSVSSLEHKRLAGVLAWWTPGSRDVVNGLAVEPEEEDGPYKLEEAVRLAFEMDPFLDAGQIKVGVRHRVVRLTGVVPSQDQSRMAEYDAWTVFGVDDVINEIEIAPG